MFITTLPPELHEFFEGRQCRRRRLQNHARPPGQPADCVAWSGAGRAAGGDVSGSASPYLRFLSPSALKMEAVTMARLLELLATPRLAIKLPALHREFTTRSGVETGRCSAAQFSLEPELDSLFILL